MGFGGVRGLIIVINLGRPNGGVRLLNDYFTVPGGKCFMAYERIVNSRASGLMLISSISSGGVRRCRSASGGRYDVLSIRSVRYIGPLYSLMILGATRLEVSSYPVKDLSRLRIKSSIRVVNCPRYMGS